MKDGLIRVGAVTPGIRVADPAYNVGKLIEAAEKAVGAGVKILVMPELSLTSYAVSDLFFQLPLLRATETALARFLAETAELDLLSFVGLPVSVRGKLYNCAAAVSGGRLLGLVPKSAIPTYGEFYEARHFSPAPKGTEPISFAGQECPFGTNLLFTCREMPSLSVATEICEDLWIPVPPSCRHAAAGATVIVNLSASDELVGKPAYRRNLVAMHSARLMTGYLFADAGAGESGTDLVFSGNNLVAENGRILAETPPFSGGGQAVGELDTERLLSERRRVTTYPAAADEPYTAIPFSLCVTQTELSAKPERTPFVPNDPAGRAERCRLIFDIQSSGLAGRMERAHAGSTVVGVSGGLDSTLALLVAVRAADRLGLPHTAVRAVTMPCFGTTARTKSNAERLSEELGVSFTTVDIRAAVGQHFADIGHNPDDLSVVYENSQARERTQVLMDMANADGGLVVGTGDLSELALGWATYNGDHMSNYAVNCSVPKTLVRHLVAYCADEFEAQGKAAVAAVLRDVLATPVSPELLPPKDGEIAQCTEGIVGPYELHDFFLYYFLRFGFPPHKIYRYAVAAFAGEYDGETVYGWLRVFLRRFFTQQFKRSCLPDGPKVGSVALSPRGDWRMPSDASSDAWLADLETVRNA